MHCCVAVMGQQKVRAQPHTAFLKNKPSELASELVRDGEWRQEGEGEALVPTFLHLFGNVETQARLSWES